MSHMLFRALCATLDQLSTSIVVMSADRKVEHANRAAQEMIVNSRSIRCIDGYLHGADRSVTDALCKAARFIAEEAQHVEADKIYLDVSLARASNNRGAVIGSLRPLILEGAIGLNRVMIALFVTHSAKESGCGLSGIAESFELTPAETRALAQFVQGGTVAEVALALKISENTVKTHLQNIFSKTGTSRQTHLLRLVNELRAPLRTASASKPCRETGRRRPFPFEGRSEEAPTLSPALG